MLWLLQKLLAISLALYIKQTEDYLNLAPQYSQQNAEHLLNSKTHRSQMRNKDCEIKTATIYYLKTNFLHINFLHWEKHPFVLKITVTVTMYLQLPQLSTYRHLDDKYKNISVLFSNNNQNVYIFTFKWI